jgi:RimJ/RimL family protein N-acetyltransferase
VSSLSGRKSDPPYRILTERLVLRCWDPGDAPLLKEAIDSSLENLGKWMPWARDEPTTIEEKAQLLRRFRGRFDLGKDFVYGIFDLPETEVVGGTGLHTRAGESALEIGYWIRDSRVGNGYATEATAALTRVAFEISGVDRVEIRVDPANTTSLAIPRRLGFEEEGVLRRRLPAGDDGLADVTIFSLFADEAAKTPSAEAPVEAFDALGRRLL